MENSKDQMEKLKLKCNAQIEKILDLEKTLTNTKKELHKKTDLIEELERKNKEKVIVAEKLVLNQDEQISSDDELQMLASALHKIIRDLKDSNSFIPYKNDCQNAREYLKLEKLEFERLAVRYIEENQQENLLKYCTALGLLKSKNNSCIFNDIRKGKSVKVILIRKVFFKYVNES